MEVYLYSSNYYNMALTILYIMTSILKIKKKIVTYIFRFERGIFFYASLLRDIARIVRPEIGLPRKIIVRTRYFFASPKHNLNPSNDHIKYGNRIYYYYISHYTDCCVLFFFCSRNRESVIMCINKVLGVLAVRTQYFPLFMSRFFKAHK